MILTIKKTDSPNNITIDELQRVYDGSLEYLDIRDIYRFFTPPSDFIQLCTKKIAIGGSIKISGIDIFEFSRKCFIGDINLDTANSILYLNGEAKSCVSLDHVELVLKDAGYIINKAYYYQEVEFVIEATRAQ